MPRNPKALNNLKPFQKGVDERRNKGGRPAKLPGLDALLAEVLGKEVDGKAASMRILEAMVEKAIGGDIRAAEMLLDRAYGKPKAFQEITVPDQKFIGFHSVADVFWKDVKEEIEKEERSRA